MPYNPSPFTDNQLSFMKALQAYLARLRDPDGEIIYSTDFYFKVKHTKKYGDLPAIIFTKNRQQVKADIMREAGLNATESEESIKKRAKHRKAAGDKEPDRESKNNVQLLANAFDGYWNAIWFQIKKAMATLAIANQHFTTENELLAEPMQILQTQILPTEYQNTIKAPPGKSIKDAPIKDLEPARPDHSYQNELDEVE